MTIDTERIQRWNTRAIEVCDRLHETLNAKVEGDMRMPERGMFATSDVLAATGVIAELRAELAEVMGALKADTPKYVNYSDGSIADALRPLHKHRVANYPSILEWQDAGSPTPGSPAFDEFESAWKSKAWGVPVVVKTLGQRHE